MFPIRNRFGSGSGLIALGLFALGLMAGTMLTAARGQQPMLWPPPSSPSASETTAISGTGRGPAGASRYPAAVTRVGDGDTFEARVQVWPGIEISTKIRLRDIDAPEMRARCNEELAKAQAARDALRAMLAAGEVSISQVGLDKYGGRVLAQVSTGRIADVSAALLQTGLVRRYSGGRREGWCAVP
jgi:endonuclease YncB( thermonuclease family)